MSSQLESVSDSHFNRKPIPAVYERTLNNTGYMIHSLDPFSAEFVDFSAKAPGPVLDVGAAFGVASLAALEAGAWVIANDIDPAHLAELRRRATACQQRRLTLMPGAFPHDCPIQRDSLGAVLLSRVMHFFSGADIQMTLQELSKGLQSGGKLFAVVEHSMFLDHPVLERLYRKQCQQNMRWPGFVTGVKELIPKRARHIPDQLHLLDEDVLRRELTLAGFEIERLETFDRVVDPDDPQSEVRQSVGVVARLD